MSKPSIIPKPITEYDLRLLRVFKAVVENGGFSAAEASLGITRSTISNHISNLEARIKLSLCSRGRGGFSLTEAGQTVYHATLGLLESLNDFSHLLGSLEKELGGEMVILCAEQLNNRNQKWLAQVIQRIHDKWPDLHLVLDGGSIQSIEKALLNEKAHVGIFPCYQQVERLIYTPIFKESVYLCCGKQHPFYPLNDHDISADMLANTASIHPGIDINSSGRECLKKLKLTARAYQFNTRKALVLSGRYLGFLPQSYIRTEVLKGEIRTIQPDTLHYLFESSLVRKRSAREANKVDALVEAFNTIKP